MTSDNNSDGKTYERARGPRSFRDLNRSLFQELNPAHSELDRFQTLLGETLQKANSDFEFTLVPIIHDQLAAPVLAVLVTKKDAADQGVGYHLVIIETEESLNEIRDSSITFHDTTFIIERTIADVYDRTYADVAQRAIIQTLEKADIPISDSGARVLYRDVRIEDPIVMHKLAYSIASAASGALLSNLGVTSELDLGTMDSSPVQLKIDYNPAPLFDEMLLPVRRDVVLTLETRPNLSSRPPQRPLEFGTVAGFMDVIPVQDKKFVPRFVITQIEPGRHLSELLSLQMLLLATTTVMTEDYAWTDALLRPNMVPTMAGQHNRLEHFLPNYRESILSQEVAMTALREVVLPKLVFSMDIANAGNDTWRKDIWAAAAHGVEGANRLLFETAERLCAGRFSTYFPNHGQIVMTEQNPIPMGYYINHLGNKADIRDIDQLMVHAMMYDRDGRTSDDWAETYMNLSIPDTVRLSKRKQILRGLLGTQIRFTDTATRVSFTAEFIQALRNGVRDAGFAVSVPKVQVAWSPEYAFASATSVQTTENSGLFRDPYRGQASQGSPNRWK